MTGDSAWDARTRTSARIRFQAPRLPPLDRVAAYYRLAEERRWYSNDGPCLQLLEQRLAEFVGGPAQCLGVGNATLGLMVALKEVATPAPGRDVVVLPSWTFVATAAAVVWAGFRPLFVDVLPDSWHPDPEAVAAAVARPDVAAVLTCSTFGTAPPLRVRAAWQHACAAAGVPLVVDSAAGFGAVDEAGERLGLQGEVEVFSFHATKPFAVGEGGLLVTSSVERRRSLGRWVNFGFDDAREVVVAGMNAKMSELTAATALAVLDDFPQVLAHRRALAEQVRAALTPHGFTFQAGAAGSAVQFVPALAPDAGARRRVLEAARSAEIELRTYYDVPVHQLPPYRDTRMHGDLPVTADLAARALSLPMANDADEHLVDAVVGACLRAV